MKQLFLFLFILNTYFISAQTGSIKGVVADEKGKLEFVSIGFTGTVFSTTSDKNGYFNIQKIPYGTYELQIAIVGYQKVKQKILNYHCQ